MELYEFQREDVEKLHDCPACVVASEMGSGKTHVAIALDEIWNPTGKLPTLVVAPLNTFDSWREKYGVQSPSSDVTFIDRKNRDKFVDDLRLRRGDVFILHWDALRLLPELRPYKFGPIIADEAHRASNRKAQATQALKKLSGTHKLALSGTLSGNNPADLWSPLNWLYPRDREFTSYWRFRKKYIEEEFKETYEGSGKGYTKITGVQNTQELHRILDPFWVRHLKRERCCPHHPEGVMPWLPEKTYDRIWVTLSPAQRRVYEQMRKEMVAWVGEHEDTPLVASVVVAQLTRLSQIALATPYFETIMRKRRNKVTGTWYTNPDGTVRLFPEEVIRLMMPSSKITAAKEIFIDNPNKQFVLFSASKQACNLALKELEGSNIRAEVLSGDTPDSQRDGMVRRFNDGGYQVFIGVIAAAGEGIDGLQHSTDTAIFLDRDWSARRNKQAEDRLDRPGQKSATQIIDVMARDTLDWGRHQQLVERWDWIKTILGDKNYTMQHELESV